MFRANVVKQDGLTVLVPVKPLVKALVIDARILESDGSAFANTRWSIKPDIIQP